MRIFLLPCLALGLISCNKNIEKYEQKKLADTLRTIDSINAARTVYNDSIRARNAKNRYRDLSGSHKLTHSEIPASGKVQLISAGRDEYKISGRAGSGNDFVEIKGTVKVVTLQYLNFEGVIHQKTNGKKFKRTSKSSFKNENKGNFWRLQDKIGAGGFVEYIDIHF